MRKRRVCALIFLIIYIFVLQDVCYAFFGVMAAKRVVKTVEGSQQDVDNQVMRDNMQKIFDGISKAFDKKDVDGITINVASQAYIEYINGDKISINEWKENTKKEFVNIKTINSSFKVESAQLYGDVVNVSYTEIHEYTLCSDEGHQYKSVSFWQSSLIKTDNGWRINHFKQLAEKTTRDNMPYAPATEVPEL